MKNNSQPPPQPISGYAMIQQVMQNDGVCTSGLNEWHTKEDIARWCQSSKGAVMLRYWRTTTTTEQRTKEIKEWRDWYRRRQAWYNR